MGSFKLHFVNFTLSPPPVLFTKNNKLWNERKVDFFVYMATSADHVKGGI